MSCVYLKTPYTTAAYYRNRDEDKPLTCFDPVRFCRFSDEAFVLNHGISILPVERQIKIGCYSQQSWQNMLRGMSPFGGEVILPRDREEWLTHPEICTLTGQRYDPSREKTEYLCIEIPKEVVIGDKQHRVNPSYSLEQTPARDLRYILQCEFSRTVLGWFQADRDYCHAVGIHRRHVETMERFLLRYGIPVGADNKERSTLLRMTNRWLREAYKLVEDEREYIHPDIKRVDAEETKRQRQKLID